LTFGEEQGMGSSGVRERIAIVFMTLSVVATLVLGGALAAQLGHPKDQVVESGAASAAVAVLEPAPDAALVGVVAPPSAAGAVDSVAVASPPSPVTAGGAPLPSSSAPGAAADAAPDSTT
jgi:hypothetical protein